jgi:hypothetical protein
VKLVQSIQQTREGYTPGDLAKLFGARPEKVRRWIEKGLLGVSRGFSPEARISGTDLLRFIEGCYHEYDLRTVHQDWFNLNYAPNAVPPMVRADPRSVILA